MGSDDSCGTVNADPKPYWARDVQRLVVLTGAGISTDSGIPDFRGPQGVWTRDPESEKLSTFQAYVRDAELRRRSWIRRLTHPGWSARPNAAHLALAELTDRGPDTWVITQNIDGLHQKAGTPPERVIELHGSMFGVECVSCGGRGTMVEALDRVRAGEDDPPCIRCGGILKSTTIMFGQALDPRVLVRAVAAARSCDLMLAVGSTLVVEPAASLCGTALEAGAALIIVNHDPTPYDALATSVIREQIGVAIPRIAGQLMHGPG